MSVREDGCLFSCLGLQEVLTEPRLDCYCGARGLVAPLCSSVHGPRQGIGGVLWLRDKRAPVTFELRFWEEGGLAVWTRGRCGSRLRSTLPPRPITLLTSCVLPTYTEGGSCVRTLQDLCSRRAS